MNVCPVAGHYVIEFTVEERSALLWAVEVACALRDGEVDASVLLSDRSVSTQLLDDLADALFLAGRASREGESSPEAHQNGLSQPHPFISRGGQ